MDGMEDQINRILSDPQSMAQIQALAQSLGLGGAPGAPQPQAPPPTPPQAPSALPFGAMDEGFARSVFSLMQQANRSDSRQEALLCALKPYLKPDRCAKLDRAMQIARLSQLAGLALRQYVGFPGL